MKSVPLQPKNLNVTTEIHPSVKRYADLSCALYVLGLSYDSLVSRALWEEPLNTLSLEMVNLLMKLASCVKENVASVRRCDLETPLVHPQQLPVCGRRLRRAARDRRGGLGVFCRS